MTLLTTSFKQKNDWTCGPAVARIVLDYYGLEQELSDLVRRLNTTRAGTSNRDLRRLLRWYDISYREFQDSTLTKLKKYVRSHLVIVAYWIPRHSVAHYSIVTRISKGRIYFHDTWYGSTHSYTLKYFEKNWWDPEATRWLMAIKK